MNESRTNGVRRFLISLFITLGSTSAGERCTAQSFRDVTAAVGLKHLHYNPQSVEEGILNKWMAGGAAAGDVDSDGWVDLYFTRLDKPDLIYRNLGVQNGVHLGFEDVTARAFPESPVVRSNGAGFGDIDNDGDLDLYVTATKDTRYYLYVNDGTGVFKEEAQARGAAVEKPDTHYGNGIAFGDYDADGFLDMYVAEWRHYPCTYNPSLAPSNTRLLRNLGEQAPGYFQDVTLSAGVAIDHVAPIFHGRTYEGAAFGFAPRFTDLDVDGRMDLILTSDFGTSRLFWNNGDGTFSDGTADANVGTDRNGMGSTVGDFDGDGRLDWFVTAINTEQGNRLYRNEGNRTFTDVTGPAGVQSAGWGWGSTFLDYDNDGDQDIVMTNGFNLDRVPDDQTTLFENDEGSFTDVSDIEGIHDANEGRGLLKLDYDNDGHLDLLVVNNGDRPVLYRNEANKNRWLRIVTKGTRSNRDGIGARITVIPDREDMSTLHVREIDGGDNYLGHNELAAHFGLGPREEPIDLVEIRWPSGIVQQIQNVAINQELVVTEPDRTLAEEDRRWEPLLAPNESPVADPTTRESNVAKVEVPMTLEYNATNGNVTFEGRDQDRYIDITLTINSDEAGFLFNNGVTGWSDRDVASYIDTPTQQGFLSFEKCQGTYLVRGGDAVQNLLPLGLTHRQLAEHLTVEYTLLGVPGTHEAEVVVIPEPSTLFLCLASIPILLIGRCR